MAKTNKQLAEDFKINIGSGMSKILNQELVPNEMIKKQVIFFVQNKIDDVFQMIDEKEVVKQKEGGCKPQQPKNECMLGGVHRGECIEPEELEIDDRVYGFRVSKVYKTVGYSKDAPSIDVTDEFFKPQELKKIKLKCECLKGGSMTSTRGCILHNTDAEVKALKIIIDILNEK